MTIETPKLENQAAALSMYVRDVEHVAASLKLIEQGKPINVASLAIAVFRLGAICEDLSRLVEVWKP